MKHDTRKVWFITGSSRGLGRALVENILAHSKDTVVATARSIDALSPLVETYNERFFPVTHDVTDHLAAQHAVAAALKQFGRIDVLVNNAGYGFSGAFEEMTPDEFAGQINTNFWGVIHTTRAVLPTLRKQQAGHIIQITSIGGRRAFPGLSGYHAAKFAVEGFSEALAAEVASFGVNLTIVEPGGFRTDWAGSSMAFAEPIAEYESVRKRQALYKDPTFTMPGDPSKAAEAIRQVAAMPKPPLRLVLGSDALIIVRRGYERDLHELDKWVELSQSTEHNDAMQTGDNHPILQL